MPAPTLVVGAPCWIDLYSSDTAKATAFYGQLFGWTAEQPQEGFGGYFTFTKDGKHVGGCMHNDGEAGYPDGWGVHLMTDDVDATAKAAPEHGGTVEFEPMTVGENGRSTMLKDPGGAMIGAWQPGTQKGFEVTGEPGTPAWFELHTRDYDKSVELLPRRLRVGRAHGERHGRVPVHDPRRRREPARRDHGRHRRLRGRRPGPLGDLLQGRRRRRCAREGRRARRHGDSSPRRTRRTAAWLGQPTRRARSSGSSRDLRRARPDARPRARQARAGVCASACSRSATRSSADSIPTESRTRFVGAANGPAAVDAWVIRAGCSIRLSTPPRLSASVHTLRLRDELDGLRPPSRRGTRPCRRSRASGARRSRGPGGRGGRARARG